MLFNSLAFGIFLPIVFALYWLTPQKYRYFVVLLSSIWFYLGFGLTFFIILLIVILVTYLGAIAIERAKEKIKKLCLYVVLIYVIGFLLLYKYANFGLETIQDVLSFAGISFTPQVLKIAVPVGISFYTFKVVSYLMDVYKGKIKAQTNFAKYAAYVTFFPQIASGPIERAEHFFETMEGISLFSYEKAIYGVKLIGWGFFKKIIIADKLSGYVTKVFSDVNSFSGCALLAAAFFFSIQIYCDFSGYSDIANGVAKLLGYDGAKNFDNPYFSSSVKEFWGRWHISLSSWFRDYIYIPLGGSRVGKVKYARNIMITFMVSGLWHGASWTYVVWGGLHGMVQVMETLFHEFICKLRGIDPKDKTRNKNVLRRIIGVIFVFVFVTAAWVFFEASTVNDALYVLKNMFVGITEPVNYIKSGLTCLGINSKMFIHLAVILGILFAFDLISLKRSVFELIDKLPVVVRYIIYVIFVDIMIIWFLQYGADSSSFVYFQF